MAHTEMKGQDDTLFNAIRELEKEMERLQQLLGITRDEDAPRPQQVAGTLAQNPTEQKVLDAIHRVNTLKQQVTRSAKLMDCLAMRIGE